jgi:hypothetical protein
MRMTGPAGLVAGGGRRLLLVLMTRRLLAGGGARWGMWIAGSGGLVTRGWRLVAGILVGAQQGGPLLVRPGGGVATSRITALTCSTNDN